MTKSFLALKAVNKEDDSIFVNLPLLKTHYELGKRVRSPHYSLPFFILAAGNNLLDYGNYPPVGYQYDKLMLVSVLAKDLTSKTPWSNLAHIVSDEVAPKTLAEFLSGCRNEDRNKYFGARSVRPLEFFPKDGNLIEWVKARSNFYHQKLLTPQDFEKE